MTDWSTISSLATAGGTLVLAIATFASIRSARRSALTAERALLAGLRPILFPSRTDDPMLKVNWADRHFTRVAGGHGAVEVGDDGVIYLAISVRNVGSGIAVLHGWYAWGLQPEPQPKPPEDFRRLSRDLYVAPGDTGFWQGAIRERDDPDRPRVEEVIDARELLTIDILYGDLEGGQRTISRFVLYPMEGSDRLASVSRHWRVDGNDPR